MGRLGIRPEQSDRFIKVLKKYRLEKRVVGIYSHLACAENEPKFTQKQIILFKRVIRRFEEEGFSFTYKHIAATAGALVVKDPEFNLIRLGLGFYGYWPGVPNQAEYKQIRPGLKLLSRIVQVKVINKGDLVSYDGEFKASKSMTIGVLPVGYYDGLSRRLSNSGVVRVGRKYCPIIGRICMNITIIDLSKIKNPHVGQEVVVISNQSEDKNSLTNLAALTQSTVYELLVGLSETTRRKLTA